MGDGLICAIFLYSQRKQITQARLSLFSVCSWVVSRTARPKILKGHP